MGAATIYDVAERAGVSISTVSLTLNHPNRVSDSSRARVIAAASELNYRPKSEAVSRARSGFGRIGVLAPFSSYPSFYARLDGVFSAISRSSMALEVVLVDHESTARATSPFLESIPLTDRLDGLIVMGVPLSDSISAQILESGLKVVSVDSEDAPASVCSITCDDYDGGRQVGRHLGSDSASRTFVYLSEHQTSDEYRSPGQLRSAGYRVGLEEEGDELAKENVIFADHTMESCREITARALSRIEGPIGLFAHSDLMAAGAAAAARDVGRLDPESVAIVGYDGGPISEAMQMTSVRQPLSASGETAAEMLTAMMKSDEPPAVRRVTLGVTLVTRASTVRPPASVLQ